MTHLTFFITQTPRSFGTLNKLVDALILSPECPEGLDIPQNLAVWYRHSLRKSERNILPFSKKSAGCTHSRKKPRQFLAPFPSFHQFAQKNCANWKEVASLAVFFHIMLPVFGNNSKKSSLVFGLGIVTCASWESRGAKKESVGYVACLALFFRLSVPFPLTFPSLRLRGGCSFRF